MIVSGNAYTYMVYYAGFPVVEILPSSQTIEVANTVTLTTTVDGIGQENFSYQWRFNETDVKGETANSLIINNATKSHEGTYQCIVRNEYGNNAISSAVLIVKGTYFAFGVILYFM